MGEQIVTPPYEKHIVDVMAGKGIQRAYAIRDRLVESGHDYKKNNRAITYRLKIMEKQSLVSSVKTSRGFEWILTEKGYDLRFK